MFQRFPVLYLGDPKHVYIFSTLFRVPWPREIMNYIIFRLRYTNNQQIYNTDTSNKSHGVTYYRQLYGSFNCLCRTTRMKNSKTPYYWSFVRGISLFSRLLAFCEDNQLVTVGYSIPKGSTDAESVFMILCIPSWFVLAAMVRNSCWVIYLLAWLNLEI